MPRSVHRELYAFSTPPPPYWRPFGLGMVSKSDMCMMAVQQGISTNPLVNMFATDLPSRLFTQHWQFKCNIVPYSLKASELVLFVIFG